ncbi:MAG: hypothetical protein Q9213_003396 [Squamulea squamosa]
MSSGLMNTEPGGEDMNQFKRSQFHIRNREVRWVVRLTLPSQSIARLTSAPATETQVDAANEQQEQDKADRGARTAENVRYGQTISEEGMGGKTTETAGSANQAGYGSTDGQDNSEESAEATRQEQGYGPGSGIGA